MTDLLGALESWAEVLETSPSLIPLLYWRLRQWSDGLVPESVLNVLRSHYRANARRNLRLLQHLVRIVRCFEQAGLEAIPFKGLTFALSAYGDIGVRPFADLDLLMRKAGVRPACELLAAQGYRSVYSLQGDRLDYWLKYDKHILLTSSHDHHRLEIHWSIEDDYMHGSLPADELWKGIGRLNFGAAVLPVLSPENTLLVSCLHATKHTWLLSQVVDFAYFITAHPDLDWQLILHRARRGGLLRILALGLGLAEALCGLTVPRDVQGVVRTDGWTARTLARLAYEIPRREEPPSDITGVRLYLSARQGFKARLLSSLAFVLTPKYLDWTAIRLPYALSPLFYLIRPVLLLQRQLAGAPRRLRQNSRAQDSGPKQRPDSDSAKTTL
ncbi:MAG: nucleotidyltransferase family protein [candidate division WOR-3 bacterium]